MFMQACTFRRRAEQEERAHPPVSPYGTPSTARSWLSEGRRAGRGIRCTLSELSLRPQLAGPW